MQAARITDPTRAFSAQSNNGHQTSYPNNNDLGFVLHIKSAFLPYIHRILAFVNRYQIIDLLAYIFGESDTGCQKQRQPINPEVIKGMKNCSHPGHKNLGNAILVREIPIRHFELILNREKKDANSGEVAQANYKMNRIFVKRLLDIEHEAPGDILLKLLTYQEWVEILLKLNKSLIRNMRKLEDEVCIRIRELRNVDIAVSDELMKNQHDIECLIQFIREAYLNGNWNTNILDLKTIPATSLLQKS